MDKMADNKWMLWGAAGMVAFWWFYKNSKSGKESMYDPAVVPLLFRSTRTKTPREIADEHERRTLFEASAADWYLNPVVTIQRGRGGNGLAQGLAALVSGGGGGEATGTGPTRTRINTDGTEGRFDDLFGIPTGYGSLS